MEPRLQPSRGEAMKPKPHTVILLDADRKEIGRANVEYLLFRIDVPTLGRFEHCDEVTEGSGEKAVTLWRYARMK